MLREHRNREHRNRAALGRTLIVGLVSLGLAIALAQPAAAATHAGDGAATGHDLYVATNGDDSNPGTADQPFRTINKAAQEAQPGDTVVVHAGTYRETVKPARGGTDEDHRITYTSAGDGDVVVKGSNQISDWVKSSGSTWSVTLPNSYFGDYNPYATQQPEGDSGGFFPVSTAGEVYLEGQEYYEKGSVDQVAASPDTWTSSVDTAAQTTTILANFEGFDPNKKLAEINVRKQVFAPDVWGLGYITVQGFTVEQAANTYSDWPSVPSRTQAGAISVNGGLKWIIQDNRVIDARTIGIDIGLGNDTWAGNRPGTARTDFHDTDLYGSNIVRNNYITNCGQSGITGAFSWKAQILNNEIVNTNNLGEFSGSETAPIKVHYMNYGLIKGNYILNSKGGNSAGIWTDWGSQGARITQNIVVNAPWGYNAEAAHGPILVDNNVFIGDGDVRELNSTGVVFANNLFLNDGNLDVEGGGLDSYYFQPGTMNETTASTAPMRNFLLNNLVQGTNLPADNPSNVEVEEGNSVGAISDAQYSTTVSGAKLSFTLDAGGISGLTPVTQQRVGTIPLADESIPADVTTDFFGDAFNNDALMPGPFANVANGANSYTLWPLPGESVPAPLAPPADAPVNLSLNPDATATASFQASGQEAALAIDGNPATRWSSDNWPNSDPNAWIQVDLGKEYYVTKTVLSWEAAYATSYKLQVSDDGQNWQDAYSTTTGGGATETALIDQNARYVRMQGIQPTTAYGYSLYEFEIDGIPTADQLAADAVTTTLNALPAPADLTLAGKPAVQAARAAYDALTGDQQKLVSGDALARLVADEQQLTPPVLAFTSPASGATVAGTIPVTVSAKGNSLQAYNLRVDSSGLQYRSKPSNGDITFSWDTTTLSNGTHTLLATATDAIGNKTTITEKVDVQNLPAWNAQSVYNLGDQVTYKNSIWEALWWTQNQQPGDPNGPWEEMITGADGTASWTPTRVFTGGDKASYQGKVYVAQWWTRDQAPGDPNGPWKLAG